MWGVLVLLLGVLYGWLDLGARGKWEILVQGIVFGAIVALVLAVLGSAIGPNPVTVGSGILGLSLGLVIMTLVFLLGVWLGDLVEGRPKRIA